MCSPSTSKINAKQHSNPTLNKCSNRLEAQIDESERLFDTYPILIYPCRIYDHGKHKGQLRPPRPDQMCPGTNWGMFNDLGVYGVPKKVRNRERYVG